MSKPITLTVYLFADDNENPRKWDVAEWLDDPTVVGWDITDGHGDCAACETNAHDQHVCWIDDSLCPDCGIDATPNTEETTSTK